MDVREWGANPQQDRYCENSEASGVKNTATGRDAGKAKYLYDSSQDTGYMQMLRIPPDQGYGMYSYTIRSRSEGA